MPGNHATWRTLKCMLSMTGGPLLEEDVDIDIWRYMYYAGRPYAVNLCDLPVEQSGSCLGTYMVNPDAICCERAILPSRLQYLDRLESLGASQDFRDRVDCTVPHVLLS